MLLLLALALAAPLTDQGIRDRIAELRPLADAIVIDGEGSDWKGLYTMRGTGDIEGISVAPTERYLAVRVDLGPDVHPLRPVIISADTGGGHPIDTIFKVRGSTVSVNFHEGRRFQVVQDVVAARTDRTVELRVAWETLKAAAPEDHAMHRSRGWMRVRAQLAREEGKPRSVPLAVASYALTFPPPPLDLAVPKPEVERIDGKVPLEGTWFVTQGAMSETGSHGAAWAYDLVIRDRSHRARLGKELGDALAWGQPVVSPARGRVRLAIHQHPDDAIGSREVGEDLANKVIIDLDDRTRFRVGHLMQDSVTVKADERVQPGQVLGRVGNSGQSSGPHAHVVHTRTDGTPAPVQWTNVTVQLNPVTDDPWARRLERWEPRGGFFVAVDPVETPTLAVPAPLLGTETISK